MIIEAKERIASLLDGFVLLDADILKKDNIVFILKSIGGSKGYLKDGIDLPTRLVYYNPEKNKKTYGVGGREWKQGVKRGWVAFSRDENSTIISCNNMALTYEISPNMEEATSWERIPISVNAEKSMTKGISGCKVIDNEVFMFGRFRKLYMRVGVQEWKDLSYENEHPELHADLEQLKEEKKSLKAGFKAIDGFSNNDIYACGDCGDCWNYDGNKWKRINLPVNSDLTSILCAGDGFVYIGLISGDIIKGRYNDSDEWKILSGAGGGSNSLAWFQGTVYIGSDLGLYTINEQSKIEQYKFPEIGFQQYSFRHVASCDEALLSYGLNQALIYDGQDWEEIVV